MYNLQSVDRILSRQPQLLDQICFVEVLVAINVGRPDRRRRPMLRMFAVDTVTQLRPAFQLQGLCAHPSHKDQPSGTALPLI